MRKKKASEVESMSGVVEYQRGSSVLYYDPAETWLEEGREYLFDTPGKIYELDEQGHAVVDNFGRRQVQDIQVSLRGRARVNVVGWGLHCGDVPGWELLDAQEIIISNIREYLGR